MQRQGLLIRTCGTSDTGPVSNSSLKYRVWVNKTVDEDIVLVVTAGYQASLWNSAYQSTNNWNYHCHKQYFAVGLWTPSNCITVDFFFNSVIITCNRIASSQTSSFFGQTSVPFMIVLRAACMRPVTSSRRAAAIQPTIRDYQTKLCCH